MDSRQYREYHQEVVACLDALLVQRYGREGDVLDRGYRLSLLEAGYGTVGVWSAIQSALDDAGTSFQTQDLNTRLDLMLRDLLCFPGDPPTASWAPLYGYSSHSAAACAFRARYGVSMAYVRRMGRLGQWLAMVRRQPQSAQGRYRLEEARRRLVGFRLIARGTRPGPRSRAALQTLGAASFENASRPRYPALLPSEAALLGWNR